MSLQVHNAIGWALVLVTLGCVGFWVPAQGIVDEAGQDAIGGSSYLIFFFHFPSAVNCLNFFIIAGGVAAWNLFRRGVSSRLDHLTATAVEVGVLACTITLVTGSIWAKAAWNVFWDFKDKRLMTVAIMWFTYLAFLALRANIDDSARRARFSAVFAVIAAVNVPLVYFSIKWFGKVSHPMPKQDLFGATSMIVTRWVGAFAFLVVYTAVWRWRWRTALANEESERLEAAFARAGI